MDNAAKTAYLVVDTESVPDGRLLSRIKYAKEEITPEEAIRRAQEEARQRSRDGSDFLPFSYQYPVAVCVIRVGADFKLQKITCLDAPEFRPRLIVKQFWEGLVKVNAGLVTFNGRGFDLPLLELAAFRYGVSGGRDWFLTNRNRNKDRHFDIMAWLTNYGACHLTGGLNLLAKLLGKPGKMEFAGDKVYGLYQAGKLQQINDYCLFDTLDTYFAFLRTRVLIGTLSLEQEHAVVLHAKELLATKLAEFPGLRGYLDNWGDWDPWP